MKNTFQPEIFHMQSMKADGELRRLKVFSFVIKYSWGNRRKRNTVEEAGKAA